MKNRDKKRSLRLKELDKNSSFMLACSLAKVQPTLRQWTKWTKCRGAAYKVRELI